MSTNWKNPQASLVYRCNSRYFQIWIEVLVCHHWRNLLTCENMNTTDMHCQGNAYHEGAYFSPGILLGSIVTWRAGSIFKSYSPSPLRAPCNKWCRSMSVASSAPCSSSAICAPCTTSWQANPQLAYFLLRLGQRKKLRLLNSRCWTKEGWQNQTLLHDLHGVVAGSNLQISLTLWRRNSSLTATREWVSMGKSSLKAFSRARIRRLKADKAVRIAMVLGA